MSTPWSGRDDALDLAYQDEQRTLRQAWGNETCAVCWHPLKEHRQVICEHDGCLCNEFEETTEYVPRDGEW
jgi:hypothetical protein